MTPAETQNLRGIRAALIQQVAQIDVLLNVQTAPKHDPEVTAKLEVAAEADRIIGYWEGATGTKPPHGLVCSWLKEHGWKEVASVANQMFNKHKTEKMTERHQVAYVAKVLREKAAPMVSIPREGVITI